MALGFRKVVSPAGSGNGKLLLICHQVLILQTELFLSLMDSKRGLQIQAVLSPRFFIALVICLG